LEIMGYGGVRYLGVWRRRGEGRWEAIWEGGVVGGSP
jgi:hypothetical protein